MPLLEEVAVDVLRSQLCGEQVGRAVHREGAGNAAVPPREGGAHTTLSAGLCATMPEDSGDLAVEYSLGSTR